MYDMEASEMEQEISQLTAELKTKAENRTLTRHDVTRLLEQKGITTLEQVEDWADQVVVQHSNDPRVEYVVPIAPHEAIFIPKEPRSGDGNDNEKKAIEALIFHAFGFADRRSQLPLLIDATTHHEFNTAVKSELPDVFDARLIRDWLVSNLTAAELSQFAGNFPSDSSRIDLISAATTGVTIAARAQGVAQFVERRGLNDVFIEYAKRYQYQSTIKPQ